MPFTIHSLVQSVRETMFLNNAGLLVEMKGSTEICRKEGESLVNESIIWRSLSVKHMRSEIWLVNSLGGHTQMN